MPANDSARARAERRERQEQRSQEVQPQAQQLEEEVQGQLDQDGDEEMPNVKSEVFEEAQLEEEQQQVVVHRPVRIRKHNRVNERQRKPMNKFKEEKFDREIRWMFFLNLRHENEGTKDAVIQAVEPQLDPMSYQYEDLWKTIMSKVNHLRGQTTNYLKSHVTDMLKLDSINGGRLNSLKTHAELAAFFQSIYSVPKFLEVFHFTQSIVDLRQQTPLALYYTKSLYANACAKTKLHLDWVATEKAYNEAVEFKKRQDRAKSAEKAKAARASNEDVAVGSDGMLNARSEDGERHSITRQEKETAPAAIDLTKETEPKEKEVVIPAFHRHSPHNREGLVVYLNNFPLAPQFAQVTRREFKEKLAKKQKKPKAEPTHVAVGLENLFFDGEPPKPSTR